MTTDDHRNIESLQDAAAAPDRQRWKALGVIALVQFILVLDITVVTGHQANSCSTSFTPKR